MVKPLHQNPWDVAPILDQGDPTVDDIYMMVGAALTSWELLDQAQASIFGLLVASRFQAAEAAYGTIGSFSGRSDMVIAAAELVLWFNQPLLAELKIAVNSAGKLSGRRNEIAHGVATGYSTHGPGGLVDHGHFLGPASYATRKKSQVWGWHSGPGVWARGKYAYTASQIGEYANAFSATQRDLSALLFKIQDYCNQEWPQTGLEPASLQSPEDP